MSKIDKIKYFLIDYSVVVFITIFLNILIRIGEFWYISSVKYQNINLDLFVTKSTYFDSLFILLFSLTIVPLFIIIAIINNKMALFLTRVSFFILVLSLFILTEYFLINNDLLSSSVFEYSFKELVNILSIELSSNRIYFVIALISLMLITLVLYFKSAKISYTKNSKWFLVTYLLLGIYSFLNRENTYKKLSYFDSYNQFLLGNSKPIFFIKTYYDNLELTNNTSKKEITELVRQFQSNFPYKYDRNKNYPLLKNHSYKNVLGRFFKVKDEKPNIVIVISESLSASFSGSNLSLKKSITPFTDSLGSKGLRWNNFFSNAERSYGVLPNLLASLPSGTAVKGFINMPQDKHSDLRFPKHNSLIKILNNNNYNTSYFYGGSKSFDYVGDFMNQNEIENCFTLEKFDTTKYSMDLHARSKQSWGYKDGDLYNQGLDFLDTIKKPYLSIFQTLSNHTPFNLADETYYSDKYLKNKLQALGLNRDDVKKIEHDVLASIFYADDALKLFFNRIKERTDYENTIFIITGDHAIDLNISDNIFENYRIPLIIYSPLLKKVESFNGLCSHIDILPSLLALLQNNYSIVVPESNHWLGEGLNISTSFEANQFIPLCIKSSNIPNIIIKNKVLFLNDVYQFDEALQITKITNSIKIKSFMNQFETYKKINEYVCKHNLIQN